MHKVLLIVNAFGGSVSPGRKEVIVKALSADFKLEVAHTAGRNHASELAKDAVDRDFDAVLAFGGDGTVNEVAQHMVGSELALGILPGGSTNVMARTLGVPLDPIEATAFLASHLRSSSKRRINVGRIDERYFIGSAGMGLDAEVVRRMELHPENKRKWGDWAWFANALKVAVTDYRGADPQVTIRIEGTEPVRALFAVCCNLRPLTYFKGWPVDGCPEATLDGALDLLALTSVRWGTIPRLLYSLLVSRSHVGWLNAIYAHGFSSATLSADRPLSVQVDGDYIGERADASLELVPQALDLLV